MVSSLWVFLLISFSFSPTCNEKFNQNHGSTLVNSMSWTCYWLLYSQVGVIDRVGTIKSVWKYVLRRFNIMFWSFRSNDIKGGLYSPWLLQLHPSLSPTAENGRILEIVNLNKTFRPKTSSYLPSCPPCCQPPLAQALCSLFFSTACLISTPIQTIPDQILHTWKYFLIQPL